MSLNIYASKKSPSFHKIISQKIVNVNSLPNVDQKQELFIDDNVCIVSMTSEEKDKMLITANYVLSLEGNIFNAPDLHSILKLYVKHGDNFVELLNGNFNCVVYNRKDNSLKIFNCRNSLYNFYYTELRDGYVFASNIRTLVACMDDSPEIDEQGVYKLFAFGYVHGNGTLIRGVQRLDPGVSVSLKGSRLNVNTYWEPRFDDYYDYDLFGIAKKFNELLIEATQLRFSYLKDIQIFLSGGLDSRLIAGAAEKAGIKTDTITYGFEGSNDLTFARLCSERLGYMNHQFVTEPGVNTVYSDLLSLIVWLTGATTNIKSMTSTKYHQFLINIGVKNYSHGSTVGSLASRHNQPFMFYPISNSRKTLMAYEHLTNSGAAVCRSLFHESFCEEQNLLAKKEFLSTFDNLGEDHFANKFVYWVVKNRLPRTVYNSLQIGGYYFNSVHFFLDKNLMDFYFRVPLKFRLESLWEKAACVTLNEKITDVPYQMTGRPISTNIFANLCDRLSARMLRNTGVGYRTKHKDAKKDTLSDLALKEYLLDNITGKTNISGFLNSQSAETIVRDHFSEIKDYTVPILKLASVFKFNEIFITDRCKHFPEDASKILKDIPYQSLQSEQ